MMTQHECTKGFFVSFDYTDEALAAIQTFFQKTACVIIPLTVQEILDQQIARRLA